jgi:hypothetical protein
MLSAEARRKPRHGSAYQGSRSGSEGHNNPNGPGSVDVVSCTDDCVCHPPLDFLLSDASLQDDQSREGCTIISPETGMT